MVFVDHFFDSRMITGRMHDCVADDEVLQDFGSRGIQCVLASSMIPINSPWLAVVFFIA